MSRRDTIILAVLINASLLSILFFTATRPDGSPPAPVAVKAVENLTVPVPSLSSNSGFASRQERQDNPEPVLRGYSVAFDDRAQQVAEPVRHVEPPQDLLTASQGSGESAYRDQQQEQYAEVMVKRGDFLEKIARTNGTTVGEIRRINNLTSDRIDIGQVLLVPATKKSTSTTASSAPLSQPKSSTISDNAEYYVIRTGDNPWNIAREHRLKVDDLLRLNNLDEDKARNLKPGDKIRVR